VPGIGNYGSTLVSETRDENTQRRLRILQVARYEDKVESRMEDFDYNNSLRVIK
jgi:hypothetical protein